MNGTRFDGLTRAMAGWSRREMLRLAGTGALLAAARPVGVEAVKACCKGRCRPLCGAKCPRFPTACPLFPADNVWNARVDGLPVHPRSADYVAVIGVDEPLHPDFGSGLWDGGPSGIPFDVVSGPLPNTKVRIRAYRDESDRGPYRIPPTARVEGGDCGTGDRHVIVVDADRCLLYELFNARRLGKGWAADSGAIWDLRANGQRPEGWTSADAAGLPILPGLVRYEEVAAGRIAHALRFTAEEGVVGHVWPGTHLAHSDETSPQPAMAHRFRLKASVDISGFSPANQVILTALKEYGMLLADFGSNWFLSGVPDQRWDNGDLREIKERIRGADFEAVDTTNGLMLDHDSTAVRPA